MNHLMMFGTDYLELLGFADGRHGAAGAGAVPGRAQRAGVQDR